MKVLNKVMAILSGDVRLHLPYLCFCVWLLIGRKAIDNSVARTPEAVVILYHCEKRSARIL